MSSQDRRARLIAVVTNGAAAIGTLGALTLANTTASSSTGTGAFICPGGAGIAGSTYVGGNSCVAGNVGIGTTTANAQIQLGNTIVNRKIVLYDTNGNDHQFYGLGINAGMLRYQISASTDSHAFWAGATGASTELARITGSGHLLVGTTSVNARLMVSGGVQNLAGEDTCIRATSGASVTKIEIANTGASGRNFELRSSSAGNFDITDRTAGATRLTIAGTHLGINASPIASGAGCIYLGSGTLPSFAPASGGCFCTQSGALYWLSQGGKTTLLATNT